MKLSLTKTHGGKYYLSPWIISKFPNNYQECVYIEPFAGGLNTLLQKEKSKVEMASDLNKDLIDLWIAVQNAPQWLMNCLCQIEYTEENFKKAKNKEFVKCVNEFILRKMSRGGLGETFAWSDRLRGEMPGDVNAYLNSIQRIPRISERIKNVGFYNCKALDILNTCNDNNVVAYCDPPYLASTRVSKKTYGEFEMGAGEHVELLKFLNNTFKGKVILSGYQSPLYDSYLKNWNKCSKEIANHSGQNKNKNRRVETLWMNY